MAEIQAYTRGKQNNSKNKDAGCSYETFITKYKEEITYENGKKIIERIPQVVNVTKKVNATAQTLKVESANEKLKQIESLMRR